MRSLSPPARCLAAAILFGLTASQAVAAEPQADFVFDALGPAACEMPPAGFEISQFRTYAENTPDAPIARGEIGGPLATTFAGGGLYGTGDQGGFVVGVQGMLFDDDPELTIMCLVLVRLGDADGTAGPVVGEDGLDTAPDGAFLGVLKLVRRDSNGLPVTFASGSVQSGQADFETVDGLLVNGSVTLEGTYTPAAGGPAKPFSATIDIPRAENVLRPALRLNRG
tara:strand:+ start:2695 stop:3369 length:675 start_codon:yes stop_codon:yes gene_type:complete